MSPAHMKHCGRCCRLLALRAFNRRTAAKDGRQDWCRACSSEWNAENYAAGYRQPPRKGRPSPRVKAALAVLAERAGAAHTHKPPAPRAAVSYKDARTVDIVCRAMAHLRTIQRDLGALVCAQEGHRWGPADVCRCCGASYAGGAP